MKIVLPGGTGQIGALLTQAFLAEGHEVVVVARSRSKWVRTVTWDGKTLGEWARELDGADAVVNLAGRTVNARQTDANLKEMMASRVDSTRVVGEAIAQAKKPPKVWLQASAATIYAHRYDAPNDEATGIIGGAEPGVPAYWARSVDIAREWERAQREANTPRTRKVVLRTTLVMSPGAGGVFDVLTNLTRFGLGGALGDGEQYVSWIHDRDFAEAVKWLIAHEELAGEFNLGSPNPLPQKEFMRVLRAAYGMPIGLPATKWMAKVGARVMNTDTELILKSRRVAPARLLQSGFTFVFPHWEAAAKDLVARWREERKQQ
ncbi:MAG: TIGR01777 family oxidoreductase [Myxococcaceae bacterium]|nr:TIGR01777 family oxidoreductase [Myxococcaceae bacterium]